MFLNPIGQWAGGDNSIYTWAPGDDGEVDKSQNWLPKEMPFYDTVAAITALGLPAPGVLYPCQEAAGSGTVYDQGSVGADLIATPTTGLALQGQRTPGLWDPVNKNIWGHHRRAVESSGGTNGFVCANTALGDPGVGSIAGLVCARTCRPQGAVGGLIQKKDNGGAGFAFCLNVAGAYLYVTDTLAVAKSALTASGNTYGKTMWHFFYYNATTGFGRVWSSRGGWGTNVNFAGLGNVVSAQPLVLFSSAANDYSSATTTQILWAGLWYGANAEDMATNWDPTYAPKLVPLSAGTGIGGISGGAPGSIYPTGYDHLNTQYPTFGYGGDDPATGHVQVSGARAYNNGIGTFGDFPWSYDPLISRSSKWVASMIGSQASSNIYYSMWIENWTKTNVVVSTAAADLSDAPDGFRYARRVTASANNGYLAYNYFSTVTIGANYYQDLFVKRGDDMVADVGGVFAVYDSGGSPVATLPFTATTKWQRLTISFVATTSPSYVRIYINNNGESLQIHNCNTDNAEDRHASYTSFQSVANCNWLTPCDYFYHPTADQLISAAAGEIQCKFRCHTNYAWADQYIWKVAKSYGAGGDADMRRMYIRQSDLHLVVQLYDSAAVLVGTADAGVVDWTIEREARFRWDTAGLPSGNYAELVLDGGAPNALTAAPWMTGAANIEDYLFGCGVWGNAAGQLVGSINYVKFFAEPQ